MRARRALAAVTAFVLARLGAAGGGAALACGAGGAGNLLDLQYYARQLDDACASALVRGLPCAPAAASPPPVLWVDRPAQAGVAVSPPSPAQWSVALTAPGACATAVAA